MIRHKALGRAAIAIALGVLAGGALALVAAPVMAVMCGWIVLAGSYCVLTWTHLRRMTHEQVRAHATADESGRAGTHVALVGAAVGSLLGVGLLLAAGSDKGSTLPLGALVGTLSVAASWTLVHLVYTMRYARAHFRDSGGHGVDFNATSDPDYQDFAYLAYTLGMCYQVSDTAINTRAVRRLALRHAILSYLLGAVVVGTTINLVVQIASTTLGGAGG
ncbi:DUF1345 domain-containing protein [Arsenicicoccus dermatophilus]|uniref:DUF1345 domain-containing protein n=1 Tax=Arsenicicoccus dermatophilus TaxID=1076331 RepID=UPI00391759B6